MTAEIAIMNTQGIALAADSAVTMTNEVEEGERSQKIFPSANKIFTLSKYQPVGVMVYGNASFMGVPWESIIKMYRSQLGETNFPALKQYSENLLSFLRKEPTIGSEPFQERYVAACIVSYLQNLRESIRKEANQQMCGGAKLSKAAVTRLVAQVVEGQYESWSNAPSAEKPPRNYRRSVRSKYIGIIEGYKENILDQLPMSKKTSNLLTKVVVELFNRFPPDIYHSGISGVVVAGFGTEDIFPCLTSFFVDGVAANMLRYAVDKDRNIDMQIDARIIPFAQKEMVVRFMSGVDPFYEENIASIIADCLFKYPQVIIDNIDNLTHSKKEELEKRLSALASDEFKGIVERLSKFKQDAFAHPVLQVVAMLPKDGLALMAHSLVSLTSFKRRMSMEAETVGEPIDVAVISKGDGFTWIKRKQYFPAELNRPFWENYFKEKNYGDKSSQRKKGR